MTTVRKRNPQRPSSPRPSAPNPGRPRPRAGQGAAKAKVKEQRRQRARRRARRAALLWSAGAVVLAGVIAAAMLATRSDSLSSSVVRKAPGFTLMSTAGKPVSLASYRGHDVVLYFSEGVGCGACFYQMREFESHAAELARAQITIVPIVMNPANQVRQEMASYGLHTPYLIDSTGSVSRAYHVLGKGMHAGLPGHGFVLVNAQGAERWYGEYPSMYLPTAGLIQQVRGHLSK